MLPERKHLAIALSTCSDVLQDGRVQLSLGQRECYSRQRSQALRVSDRFGEQFIGCTQLVDQPQTQSIVRCVGAGIIDHGFQVLGRHNEAHHFQCRSREWHAHLQLGHTDTCVAARAVDLQAARAPGVQNLAADVVPRLWEVAAVLLCRALGKGKPVAAILCQPIGADAAAMCHLANISYRLKRKLEYDPAKMQFVNDIAANKMLTRPYRAPYVVPTVV